MAITLADAVVYITGDDGPFQQTAGRVRGRVSSLVAGVGSSIATLGTAAVLGGITAAVAGVGAIGVAAFNVANDVDQATGRLQTQLGLTEEQAGQLGDVITRVYGNNFGESIDDVGASVGTVSQQMNRFGEMSADEIQRATETAIALRDAFDVDVAQSTNAANALMEQFGLSADEAFLFVQKGLESGLNSSGDFLETITEYSNQFAEGGATAGEFFSVMDTGLASGLLGTDKAADLFKEFRVRIQDGSDSTREALEAIGLDADAMAAQMADGSITAMDAFGMIQGAMAGVDDENVRFQAGVALMGSQFEDLGTDAVANLDPLATTMEDITTTAGDLSAQYDNLPTKIEGLKRRVTTALVPLGEALLPLGEGLVGVFEKAVPYIEIFALWLAEKLPVAIATFRRLWEQLVPRVQAFIARLAAWWDRHGQGIIDTALRVKDLLLTYVGGVWENIRGLFEAFRSAFSGDWEGFGESIGEVLMNSIETALSLLEQLWDLVVPWLTGLWENFVTWFQEQDWKQNGLDIINNIADAISGFWGVVQPWLAGLWENFATWFQETDWKQLGFDVVTAILEGLHTLWTETLPALGQFLVDIGAWFMEQDWGALAQTIIDGLVSGITNGASAIAGALTDLAEGAMAAWNQFWDSHSPSRRMIASGEDITAGAEIGLRSFQERVVGAMGLDSIGSQLATGLGALVAPQLDVATALAGGRGPVYNSQDQFTFPINNPRDAALAARLVEQARTRKLKEFQRR